MAVPRLGRSGLWRRFTASSPILPLHRTSLQPFQPRLVSYQSFPRRGDPRRPQYNPRFLGNNRVKVVIATVGVGSGVVYVSNQETVPITGRRRFNIVSANFEKQLLGGSYEEVLREFRGRILPPEHPHTRTVENVVGRLLPSVRDLAGDEWRVHVVDDPQQKNAFVIPGGKVFVFTGLLPICHDEDGLAVVLGHEIAHNVAHHAAERISRSFFLLPFMLAAISLFDISGSTVSLFTNLIFQLPNSRTHESEADHIGLLMMAQACFDPGAAVPFWERMKTAQKGAPPQFLSTHPSDYNRIKAISEWLPEAKIKYESGGCGPTGGYVQGFKRTVGANGSLSNRQPVGLSSAPPARQGDDDFW